MSGYRSNKEKLILDKYKMNSLQEFYLILIDLLNKKQVKLDELKKDSKIIELIEKTDINTFLAIVMRFLILCAVGQ